MAGRLAEGVPAVANAELYVSACRLLGYQNGETGNLREQYGTEDGLDLHALDADCASLASAARSVERALADQDGQRAALAGAWRGRDAVAALDFLRRHGESSARVAAALRRAADTLTALRDDLWRVIDAKVSTTQAIDRPRADWQAAARTVVAGAGDRSSASELVDQQIKPFVADDVGTGWIRAMRAATAAVDDAYRAAVAELQSVADVVFDVPGDLGPLPVARRQVEAATVPAAAPGAATGASPLPLASFASAPAAPSPQAATSMPAAQAPPVLSPEPATTPAASPMPSGGAPGGGMPDLGGASSGLGGSGGLGGLGGFGQQLADLLGGLVPSSDGLSADLPEVENVGDVDAHEPNDSDEPDDDEDDDEPDDDEDDEDDPETDPDEVGDDVESDSETADSDAPGDESADPEAAPTPTPVPASMPAPDAAPVPDPPPLSAEGETPCEIAADALPQAGR